MIDISKFTKAEVLAALFNASQQQGMGLWDTRGKLPMTNAQANEIICSRGPNNLYFDYLYGRVMKVDISGDTLDPTLYDRDNGPGAAGAALALRCPYAARFLDMVAEGEHCPVDARSPRKFRRSVHRAFWRLRKRNHPSFQEAWRAFNHTLKGGS